MRRGSRVGRWGCGEKKGENRITSSLAAHDKTSDARATHIICQTLYVHLLSSLKNMHTLKEKKNIGEKYTVSYSQSDDMASVL